MAGTGAGDEIHLEVPTTPDLLRLVRVAASGLASRLGFAIEGVEDVRLAVDELCWTVSAGAGPTASLAVRFVVLDRAFTVEARLQTGPAGAAGGAGGGGPETGGGLSALSTRILGTLVEDYEVLPPVDGQGAGFRMRTKRA